MRKLSALNITLAPIFEGTSWSGLANCKVEDVGGGSETANPLAEVVMGWEDEDGNRGMTLTSEASGADESLTYAAITITDAAAWEFDILPIDLFPLGVAKWSWTVRTIDTDGRTKVFLAGTKEVKRDPSKPTA